MDEIINKLIEVDKHARGLVQEAEDCLKTSKDSVAQERQTVRDSYGQEALHRIQALREQEKGHLDTSRQEVDERYQKRQAELEKLYTLSHQKWEQQIFERCLDR